MAFSHLERLSNLTLSALRERSAREPHLRISGKKEQGCDAVYKLADGIRVDVHNVSSATLARLREACGKAENKDALLTVLESDHELSEILDNTNVSQGSQFAEACAEPSLA